jgi:hypothetical protein
MLTIRWRAFPFRFTAVGNSDHLSVSLTFLGSCVTSQRKVAILSPGSRNPSYGHLPAIRFFRDCCEVHRAIRSVSFAPPLASFQRLAKGVTKGLRLADRASSRQRASVDRGLHSMMLKKMSLAAVVGGSVFFLSGCQSTGQYAPPTYLTTTPVVPPPPAISPPTIQPQLGQPPSAAPVIESQPPPLAPEPKRPTAPTSTPAAPPPKLERVA